MQRWNRASSKSPCGRGEMIYRVKRFSIVLITLMSIAGVALSTQKTQAAESTQAEDSFRQASTRLEQGNFQGAIQAFNQAIELNPDYMEAYCERGLSYALLGDYQKAIEGFRQAIEIDPNHVDAYARWGTALASVGDLQGAIEKFDEALQLDSNFVDAYYNRGLAYYSLNNFERAVEDFTQVIQRDSTLAQAYGRRGLAYNALSNRSAAISDLQQAATLFQQQGDRVGYQQTLDLIRIVQR